MSFLRIAMLFAAAFSAAWAQLSTAIELNSRGNQAADAGRYEEAIGLYRESLAIWSASGPEYDAHRAGTLFNLAIAVSSLGDRPQAARVLEQAFALHRRTLGMEDSRTLSNLNLLASNYLMIGEIGRAEALLEEALPIERRIFPESIQTARTLGSMCNVSVKRGRFAEALARAEASLEIATKTAGEDSLDAALAYSNVAESHRLTGHPERALPLFRRARLIYEKALGPYHPRVASVLSQEGLILLDDRKPASAEELLVRSVDAVNRSCPKCSVELAIAENNLALLRFQQKRYTEAGDLMTHVIKLRESFTASPGPELAGALRLLAAVRAKEKRFDDAARLTSRADVILGFK